MTGDLTLALVVAGGSRSVRLGRALLASGLMTAGFVAVFGVFGLISTAVASTLQRYLPVVTMVIGLVLVIMGILLLAGRELFLLLPKPKRDAIALAVLSGGLILVSGRHRAGPKSRHGTMGAYPVDPDKEPE